MADSTAAAAEAAAAEAAAAATTTEKPNISDTINKVIGGEKPLITTNNKVELNTKNIAQTALVLGGIWFFFVLLLTFAKKEINK